MVPIEKPLLVDFKRDISIVPNYFLLKSCDVVTYLFHSLKLLIFS